MVPGVWRGGRAVYDTELIPQSDVLAHATAGSNPALSAITQRSVTTLENIHTFLEFVNEQANFHSRMAEKHASDTRRRDAHTRTSDRFRELEEFLKGLKEEKPTDKKPLMLSWDEVAELPEELLAELSISDADKTEFNVLSVVRDAGGVISLDRLLIGYWQLTGEVMKRAQMTNRIYRMIQKGMLYSVPNRKGVYSIQELSEEEAANLA